MQTEINKKEDYERRARECSQSLHGLLEEAKRDGHAIDVRVQLGIDGKPRTDVSVLLR